MVQIFIIDLLIIKHLDILKCYEVTESRNIIELTSRCYIDTSIFSFYTLFTMVSNDCQLFLATYSHTYL